MSGNEKNDSVDGASAAETLHIWIERLRRNIELDLRVSMPARVVAYDPTLQKATVRIELLPIKYVGDDEIPDVPIVLTQIPVRWPRSMGGLCYQTMPVLPADTGHVLFTDRSLSVWLLTGNPVAPVDPVTGRTHALSDAFFEPGLHTDADAITPPTDLTAHVIEGPLVKIGAGALPVTGSLALAQALHTYLVGLWTAIVPVALDGGASLKSTGLAYLGSSPFTAFATIKALGE